MSPKRFKRFEIPEIILHWFQGAPFLVLLITGGMMLASRFYNMDLETFTLLKNLHKIAAVAWATLTPFAYLFIGPRIHFTNLKSVLTWGMADIRWMVLSVRCLFDSNIEIPDAGKFNTGQKINSLLVMAYFFGFAATGFLMWFRGTILVSWYLHASLFFAALSSVSGHLYLSFINPSTRVGLGGIFHGWVPLDYIEHHHALCLTNGERDRRKEVTLGFSPEKRKIAEVDHKKKVGSSMKVEIIFLICTVILGGVGFWIFAYGQKASLEKGFNNIIRPRELSGAHNTKEIIGNCTLCHTYAGELANEKCLACHKIIQVRLVNSIGFHGTFTDKTCRECHKEHPALKTGSIIPFDPEKFDHSLAAFKKEGKHADPKIKCDDCHKKKRKKVFPGIYYLGLQYDSCVDCHTDPHTSTLGTKCTQCHSVNGWQGKALNFDHNRDAQYKLVGKHAEAKCRGCHIPPKKNGPLGTAVFRGLKLKCANCHKDPHQSQFGEYCLSCHIVSSWKGKDLKFDHNLDSKFKLKGKHAKAKCVDCHKTANEKAPLATALFRGLKPNCTNCHKDPHNSNLGSECHSCHSFQAWKGDELNFDHNYDSQYRLKNKHAKAKCVDCHKPADPKAPLATALFRGMKTECTSCHKDPHAKELGTDCEKCHNFKDWRGDELQFDHNQNARYKLEGKHTKVACNQCHKPRPDNTAALGTAQFTNLMQSTRCDNCHQDPHKGEYGKDCLPCHTVSQFPPKKPNFSHDQHSNYPLVGKHAEVLCVKCHHEKMVATGAPKGAQKFLKCDQCHEDFHKNQLGSDCNKCHSPNGWKGKNLLFKHNTQSRYAIDNLHVKVKCSGCHKNNHYKPIDTACENCHKAGTISRQR
ncbi:cytochrome b/b6 domain-containing protein [Thermodesulfobacteriota bacterium]